MKNNSSTIRYIGRDLKTIRCSVLGLSDRFSKVQVRRIDDLA